MDKACIDLECPFKAEKRASKVDCVGHINAKRHSSNMLRMSCYDFFCSNALIALARSLCKCLLAVLITASEADAVAGFFDLWCQAV